MARLAPLALDGTIGTRWHYMATLALDAPIRLACALARVRLRSLSSPPLAVPSSTTYSGRRALEGRQGALQALSLKAHAMPHMALLARGGTISRELERSGERVSRDERGHNAQRRRHPGLVISSLSPLDSTCVVDLQMLERGPKDLQMLYARNQRRASSQPKTRKRCLLFAANR